MGLRDDESLDCACVPLGHLKTAWPDYMARYLIEESKNAHYFSLNEKPAGSNARKLSATWRRYSPNVNESIMI